MARLRLRDDEVRAARLPELCMVCGEPSTQTVRKKFQWSPAWVGFLILAGVLPYVIVAAILTKYMTVEVPVCARHRGYFRKRSLIVWGALVACITVPVLVCAGGMALVDPQDRSGAFMAAIIVFAMMVIVGAFVT